MMIHRIARSASQFLEVVSKTEPDPANSSILPYLDGFAGLSDAIQAHTGKKPRQLFDLRPYHPPRSPESVESDDALDIFPTRFPIQSGALSKDGEVAGISLPSRKLRVVESRTGRELWTLEPSTQWQSKLLPSFLWLEFVLDESHIVGEDMEGMVWLLSPDGVVDVKGPLSHAGEDYKTAVSPGGSQVVRATVWSSEEHWSTLLVLIDIAPSQLTLLMRPLEAVPRAVSEANPTPFFIKSSLAFSPNGMNVGAFDAEKAHVWSTRDGAHVGTYSIQDNNLWRVNLIPEHMSYFVFHPTLHAPSASSTCDRTKSFDVETSDDLLSTADPDSAVFVEISEAEAKNKVNWEKWHLGPRYDFTTLEWGFRSNPDGPALLKVPPELMPPRGQLRYTCDEKGDGMMLTSGRIIVLSPPSAKVTASGEADADADEPCVDHFVTIPPLVVPITGSRRQPRRRRNAVNLTGLPITWHRVRTLLDID